MHKPELATAIANASTLTGQFTLRSGATSTEYFDKYRFEADPRLMRAITEHLAALIPSETEALAGLELGGVPLATALSLRTGLPAIFVRKAAKTYGTCQLAEGGTVDGKRLLVIEDVVTSGGQVIESAVALRGLGAVITHAICVIDRESGGSAALEGAGIALTSLFCRSDLMRKAKLTLITAMLAIVPLSTIPAQPSVPVRDLVEEMRIVSSETVPRMSLTAVTSATVLPDGRVLTLHGQEGIVRVFNPAGRLVTTFGGKGSGPGEFRNPRGLGFVGRGDTIWVSDGPRYQVFNRDFKPIDPVTSRSTGGHFYGLASGTTSLYKGTPDTSHIGLYDRLGTLIRNLAVEYRFVSHRFEIWDPDLMDVSGIRRPAMRTMSSPLGAYTTVEMVPGGREMVVLEPAALWGGKPGQFRIRRVTLATGAVSAPITVSLPARRVTPREADSLVASRVARTPKLAEAYRAKVQVPEYFPAFSYYQSSADSMLLLTEYASGNTRLLMDFKGTALARVRLPAGLWVFAINRTHIWGVLNDADDLPIIVRYRVGA